MHGNLENILSTPPWLWKGKLPSEGCLNLNLDSQMSPPFNMFIIIEHFCFFLFPWLCGCRWLPCHSERSRKLLQQGTVSSVRRRCYRRSRRIRRCLFPTSKRGCLERGAASQCTTTEASGCEHIGFKRRYMTLAEDRFLPSWLFRLLIPSQVMITLCIKGTINNLFSPLLSRFPSRYRR